MKLVPNIDLYFFYFTQFQISSQTILTGIKSQFCIPLSVPNIAQCTLVFTIMIISLIMVVRIEITYQYHQSLSPYP